MNHVLLLSSLLLTSPIATTLSSATPAESAKTTGHHVRSNSKTLQNMRKLLEQYDVAPSFQYLYPANNQAEASTPAPAPTVTSAADDNTNSSPATTTTDASQSASTTAPTQSTSGSASASYLGCFNDDSQSPAMPYNLGSGMRLDQCLQAGQQNNYAYVGLQGVGSVMLLMHASLLIADS